MIDMKPCFGAEQQSKTLLIHYSGMCWAFHRSDIIIWLRRLPLHKLLKSWFPWSLTLTWASSLINQKAWHLLKPNKFPAVQLSKSFYMLSWNIIWAITKLIAWCKPQRKLLLMIGAWHKEMLDIGLLNKELLV